MDEGDICSHCGSSGYDEDIEDDEENNQISTYDYFYRQAKTCSIKGDHASAIGFYKELLRLSGPITNCEVLSAIAYEYETMGDYGSAEEYWNRCGEIKNYDSYRYIAEKGDFLYRRERYEDAIDTYQEALKTLDGPKDKSINISQLKCYARAIHFIIYSYNYLGKNNMEEEYHNS